MNNFYSTIADNHIMFLRQQLIFCFYVV